MSERRVCPVLAQPRTTHRYEPVLADDEVLPRAKIVGPDDEYGRHGLRRIKAPLHEGGWHVNHKRVERLWRQKVPKKHAKRGRPWLNELSCLRLRPEYPNHVWSDDLVAVRTHDRRPLRILTVVDEYTRHCLAFVVARRMNSSDVVSCLERLMLAHGIPSHIRSENGPEFTADKVREWLAALDVGKLLIEPGSRGRTPSTKAPPASYATGCSTERSYTPCSRPRPSSRTGAYSTTMYIPTVPWGTGLPRQKHVPLLRRVSRLGAGAAVS